MKNIPFNLIKVAGLSCLLFTSVVLLAQNKLEKKSTGTFKAKLLQQKEAKKATTANKTEVYTRATMLPDEIVNLNWSTNWDTIDKDVFTYVPSSNLVSEKITKLYVGINTYDNSSKETNTYDTSNNLILKEIENWNSTTNSWDINSREEYEFDTYNNQTINFYLSWNINLNQWDTLMGYKNEYTYNANGDILTNISSSYNSGVWTYEEKVINDYDSNGFLIATTYQSYFGGWDNDFKEEYIVNTNGEWNEVNGFSWDGVNWFPDYKVINITWYSFTDFKLTGYVFQLYDGTNYINQEKFTGTYHTNSEALNELYETWNANAWENSSMTSYAYDSNNNTTEEHHNNWNGTAWELNYGFNRSYTYDSDNNILTIEIQMNDMGVWENYQKHLYVYNSISVPVKETSFTKNFNIYPNPFQGNLFVEVNGNDKIKISVYNMTGQSIFTETFTGSNISAAIDFSEFTKGIYMVQISNAEKVVTKKVVKN